LLCKDYWGKAQGFITLSLVYCCIFNNFAIMVILITNFKHTSLTVLAYKGLRMFGPCATATQSKRNHVIRCPYHVQNKVQSTLHMYSQPSIYHVLFPGSGVSKYMHTLYILHCTVLFTFRYIFLYARPVILYNK